uniref:Uncharacterized protein n=1 Tax=Anguilla anguilla TaxID=7936 RepID=A0A0E9WLY1_ANGAN
MEEQKRETGEVKKGKKRHKKRQVIRG